MSGPLAGIKCIAMTMFQAGPVCFAHFADLGAEVVKIERPGTGELGRMLMRYPNFPVSPYFETNNRGVKSLTLNIRSDKGKEILYKLVKDADVFGQNFRPGAADRGGFGYNDLIKHNPGLVYLSISGYGPDGPNALLPATDGAAQAAGGIASAYAQPGMPMRTGQVSVADETAGMTAFTGALAALVHAKMTGKGQKVDVSLVGAQTRLMGYTMTRTLMTGQEVRGGQTRITGGAAPNYNASFTGKEGKPFMFQVVGEPSWAKGMEAAGFSKTLAEIGCSKLAEVASSPEKQKVLLDTLGKLFATDSREHWLEILRGADIVSAPINTLKEASVDADNIANQYVTEVEHPKHGPLKEVGSPWKFSESPVKLGIAPELGEHNSEVLTGLGYSAADMEQLTKDGVI
jgi:crotonobetainyl-CoA:carnitine CoA-transferase CaiB-like acyl-CoA transferase